MAQVTRAKASHKQKGGVFEYYNALPWWQKYTPIAFIQVLTFVFYYPSLNYPFQFDDIANITKNFMIRGDNPLARWWWHRRWVGSWLNGINFRFGHFEPFFYRLLNLAFHMAAGALVFFIVLRLCHVLKQDFFVRYSILIASITSGLFLLHPLQTQTVSYVIQGRVEGVASLLILLAIFAAINFLFAQQLVKKIFFAALLVAATTVACGTKEIFVLIVPLLLLIDWIFLSKGSRIELEKRKFFYLCYFSFFACVTAIFLFEVKIPAPTYRKNAINFEFLHPNENNIGNVLTEDPTESIKPLKFAMSQCKVVLHYMRLIIWPSAMSVEYDWKMARSFFSAEVLFPLLFLLVLLIMSIYFAWRGRHQMIAFGLLWFFVALSPRSSFIPSAELVCDYKTYLASIGLFLLIAVFFTYSADKFFHTVLASLRDKQFLMRVVVPALAVVLLPLGALTMVRNRVWSSNELFWADCVKKAPKKARVHNNYGVALCEAGHVEHAIQEYKKAIQLDQRYQDPLSNIAVAYSMQGKHDHAVEWLKRAIQLCPNYPEAHNNLGSLYIELGRLEEAEQALNKALELRAYYGKAFFNFARIYEVRGDFDKVWEYLKKATEGDLDVPEAFVKYGLAGLKTKRYAEAIVAFEYAIKRGERSVSTWFNYANALYLNADHDRAVQIYSQLAEQEPQDYRFQYNLAETYFAKGDYNKALAVFDRVTKLPNFAATVVFRIAACYEKMNEYSKAHEFLVNVDPSGAPDEFKENLNNEITRLALQDRINKTGGVMLSDITNLARQRSGTGQHAESV